MTWLSSSGWRDRVRHQPISLRNLLIVPFVVQVVGIVGLVGYLSYRSGQQAVDHLAHHLMEETGDRVVQKLDSYLQKAHRINQSNIVALRSGAISLDNLDQLHQYLILQFLQTKDVTTVLFGTPQGDLRVIHRVSPDDLGVNTHLQAGEPLYEAAISDVDSPALNQIYSIDAAGRLDRYLETMENIDVRDRPWYRRAVETQRPGWTAPFQIGRTNLLGKSAYAPVYNEANQLQGVFAVHLSLRQLNDFLKTLSASDDGQIFIMQRDGLLIADSIGALTYRTSERELSGREGTTAVSQPGQITFQRLSAADSPDPVMRAAVRQLEQTFGDLNAIQSPQELQVRLNPHCAIWVSCDRHFLHVDPYQDKYGLDWLVVTVLPESHFMADIWVNVRRTVMVCGLALVGSVAIGIWITRRITRSLLQLTQATQAITTGQLNQPLPPSQIREVSTLSDSFDHMAATLQQVEQLRQSYEQDLRQHVADQTAALHESMARLQAAQRIAQIGSWELDIATRTTLWSDELFRIAGRSPAPSGVAPFNILELVHPDERDTLRQAVDAAIAYGTPYKVEHRITRPDGTMRYLVSRGEPIYNHRDQIIKLAGTVADITNRKQAEETLRQSEERFRDIAQTVSQFFFVRSAITGQFTYVSPAYEAIWGRTCASLYDNPDSWMEAIHPEDRPTVQQSLETQFKGHSLTREYRIIRSDGEIRWIFAQITAVQNDAGQLERLIGCAADITDRKQVEQALQQSERRFQTLVKNMPGMVYRYFPGTDGVGRFTYVSSGTYELLELTPAQILNDANALWNLIYPDDLPPMKSSVAIAVQTMADWEWEGRLITPSGQLKWIQGKSRVQDTPDGAVWDGLLMDVSDRKRTELALADESDRRKTLFNNSIDGIVVLDQAGNIIEANASFANMLGYSLDEITTLNLIDFDAHWTTTELEHKIETSTFCTNIFETRHRRKDGSIYHVEISANAVDWDGQPVQLCICRDSSDRKHTEELLSQSEARYRGIVEDQTELIMRLQPNGILLFANDAFCRYYGVAKGDVIGHRYQSRIYPEDQAAIDRCMAALTPENPIGMVEHRVIAKGKVRWMQWVNRAIYDNDGKLVELQAVGRDIDDRKRAELALQYTTQQLQTFLDHAPTIISLFDADGRYLQVNPAFARLLDIPVSRIIGQTFADFLPASVVTTFQSRIQTLIETRKPLEVEDELMMNGDRRIFQSLLFPILVSHELPTTFWAIATDITDRKAVERMKDEFISIVSHELRTPLTAIHGALGLLSVGIYDHNPEKAKHMLNIAAIDCDRLVRLVNDILALERLESGQQPMEKTACDAASLMYQAIEGIRAIANQSDIILVTHPITAHIWANPDAILQTLTNLLSNAIKFSPAHSTVTLTAEQQGDIIQFQVGDRGRGIPTDKLKTIFERFQQVDVSDSRQKGGTGLGLSICQSLVAQHGGMIWVESVVGEGSTFYFTIPIAELENP